MEGLREYMQARELTQAELATQLGVSQPTVSDWLNGKTKPTAGRLLKISKKTGVSVDELLKGPRH
jgi:transcriptional regulator with XRE-family HTH domain